MYKIYKSNFNNNLKNNVFIYMYYLFIILLFILMEIFSYCDINFNVEKKMLDNLKIWNEIQNGKISNQLGGLRYYIFYNKNITN